MSWKLCWGAAIPQLLERVGVWSGQTLGHMLGCCSQLKPWLAMGHCVCFNFAATSEKRGKSWCFVIYWKRVWFLWSFWVLQWITEKALFLPSAALLWFQKKLCKTIHSFICRVCPSRTLLVSLLLNSETFSWLKGRWYYNWLSAISSQEVVVSNSLSCCCIVEMFPWILGKRKNENVRTG